MEDRISRVKPGPRAKEKKAATRAAEVWVVRGWEVHITGVAVAPETVETLSRSGAPQNAAEASTRSNATANAFQVVITVYLSIPPGERWFDRSFPGEEWHGSLPPPVTAVTGRGFF